MKQSRTVRFDTDKEDDIKALDILKALKEGRGNQFIIEAIINYDKQVNGLSLEDIRRVIREELKAAELPTKEKDVGVIIPEQKILPETEKLDEIVSDTGVALDNMESLNKAISFIGTL